MSQMRGPLVLLVAALSASPAVADTFFTDYMSTLRSLTPRGATCTDAVPGQSARCTEEGDGYAFTVTYEGGTAPSVVVSAVSSATSWKGMEALSYFNNALSTLGFPGNNCAERSLNSNFTPFSVEKDGYKYVCLGRADTRTGTMEQRFTITPLAPIAAPTPPAKTSKATTQTSAGGWQFKELPDGRPIATISQTREAEMEFGTFETFSIICARGGGLKMGLESVDGVQYPAVNIFPPDGARFSLANNEIIGPDTMNIAGVLMATEQKVLAAGRTDMTLVLEADGDAYETVFDITGFTDAFVRVGAQC